ncbi:RICIN domain-containing protein [Roseateles sp. DAIF2]|uniref:RICIN domain-containing protein n=1 Tax=Roseateles sp. DAIF2 TaxID=2714952 RepID=UPI0018A2970E|nr:RICIN domain-containing protein [Roseateles sp. DAIF2]QPF71646.1 RICIN domain-containing protein [Roseateles sp. DAIF2]
MSIDHPPARKGGTAGRLLGLTLLAVLAGYGNPAAVFAQPKPYLALADRLDRPQDGYCIDIAGSGDWIDVTIPLAAHNCKGPATYPDQAVRYDPASGQVRFYRLQVCMTALGRNGRSLAQMPLLAQPCVTPHVSEPLPFASAALQAFDFRSDGRLELRGSGLCVVAGASSDTTFSPADKWRALQMTPCTGAPAALSVWVRPPAPSGSG